MENADLILSIIVPSYKTKEYLNYTIPPFLLKEIRGKVMVYFVDDGSTDDTAKYLKRYVKLNPDIFKYVYKDNGGHGSVINYGVYNLVKTKYFMVLDGDDFVDSKQLSILVNSLYKIDIDIIVMNYNLIINGKTKLIKTYDYSDIHKINIEDLHYTLHSVVFKTDLWISNNIKMTEKVFYEDNQYCLYPKLYCKTSIYIPVNVYNYNLGLTGQSVSPKNVIIHRYDLLKVLDDIIDFSKNRLHCNDRLLINYINETENNIYNYYYEFVLYYLSGYINTYLDLKKLNNKYKNEQFIKNSKKYYNIFYIVYKKTSFYIKKIVKIFIHFLK